MSGSSWNGEAGWFWNRPDFFPMKSPCCSWLKENMLIIVGYGTASYPLTDEVHSFPVCPGTKHVTQL